jgi:hypothetical protein
VTKVTANIALEGHAEKRIYERYNCEALIKWSYFNQDKFFDAKIFNFSRDGIYFETSSAIRQKATIFIRLETLFTKNMRLNEQECLRTVSLGDVRWCQELSKDDMNYYAVGVRHCEVKY